MTEQIAHNLRNQLNSEWLANQDAFYGKYKVPGTAISLIMLNTFDIRDSHSGVYLTVITTTSQTVFTGPVFLQNIRHSRSRISSQQATWLTQALAHLTPDEQVIVFTHDSIRSATDRQAVKPFWTYDWFANNQQGDFARVYDSLVKHRNQIIAIMSGHTHVDDWSQQDGLNWIATTSDVADRRKTSRLGSRTLGAWDLSDQSRNSDNFRPRYIAGKTALAVFVMAVPLFGDGILIRHNEEIIKPPNSKPATGNAYCKIKTNRWIKSGVTAVVILTIKPNKRLHRMVW